MKRDMDLIRRIVLALDEAEGSVTGLDGVETAAWAHHARLLIEAELCAGIVTEFLSDDPPYVVLGRLTWKGYDFADSIREDTVWNKAKAKVIRPGASWTFGLLAEVLKQEIQAGFPTLRH